MKDRFLKTMKYDSPSGKIRIDKLIPPFMPVQGGFGFMGVTAIDVGTGKIQCHTCGQWHEQLGLHIFKAHGILSNAYREKYGLYKSAALQSDRLRAIRSQTMHKMRASHPKHRFKFKSRNGVASNQKGKKHPLARANRHGVCELQVADRIAKVAKKLGRTPGLLDLQKEYGGGFIGAIRVRYGSYIALVRRLGYTPLPSSHNPKYSKEFFVQKGVKAVTKENKQLKLMHIFSESESRHIYRYCGSWKKLQRAILDEMIAQADLV